MPVDVNQVSFSKGEVSPIAAARTDEAFYASALTTCENFFVRAEGAVSNRPGQQYIATCLSSTPNGSYLLPFVYNNQQSYVTEFAAGTTAIYANGALVTSIGNSYAYADLPALRIAQSADVMNVVVATQPPMELTRTTPLTFTFTTPNLLNGPFQDINIDGTTWVYASGTQGSVTLTASRGIFTSQHVGALFTIQEQFLDSIDPWESQKVLFQGGNTPIGIYRRSDSKIYQCVNAKTATTATATGTFQPAHTSGTQQDGDGAAIPNFADVVGVSWQFVSTNAGVAKITAYISPTQVTAVVQSDKGVYSNFPPTVVGGPVTIEGPFAFTGNGVTRTFTPLTGITIGDPNQFYVTVAGVFSDPTTYTVSLSGTSITFNTAPVGAISVAQVTGTLTQPGLNQSQSYGVYPLKGMCLSTYWAFGSFSAVQGYPSTVVYFNDRLVFGGTQLQPQSAFTSMVSNYPDFGVSSPQVDSDGIEFTLNARLQNPIVDLIPLGDLLIGTASCIWRVTHSAAVGAITPSDISLLPQNFYGQHPVPSVQTGDTVIYTAWGGRRIYDLLYQFQFDKFQGQELTTFARHLFPAGTTVARKAFAPLPFGLLYVVRSDGVMCVCAYLPEQQITAWSRYITAGFYEDVCVVPENGSYAVYVIVRRTVNNATVRYIERFVSREYDDIDDAFFVDSGLTYDGRNTSTTTMALTGGTTWLANDEGTVTASSTAGWAGFQAADATNSNSIWFTDADGNRLARLQIIAVVNATIATVQFSNAVPVVCQGMPSTSWTFAKTNFSGLTNLVGESVSIFADGAVQPSQVVSGSGTLSLQNPGGVVHAGLGYTSQLQSMNLNLQGQATIRNRKKSVVQVSAVVDESYPFMVGSKDFSNLSPVQQRQFEAYGTPVQPATGLVDSQVGSSLLDDQYVTALQDQPVPLTICSWIASVDVGEAV